MRLRLLIAAALSWGMLALPAYADAAGLMVPLNRSTLVTLPTPMAEVMVAAPEIADVHAHNSTHLTVVGKQLGRTNIRIFDKEGKLLRDMEVTVGYDLPAIRQALKTFLPEEVIGVDMVNTSVALTGQVSSAAAADKALKIVRDFVEVHKGGAEASAPTPVDKNTPLTLSPKDASLDQTPEILNLLQVTSGQQVMLRVRVGEIDRTALKTLGVDLSGSLGTAAQFGTGSGLAGLLVPASISSTNSSAFHYGPGSFLFPTDSNNMPTNTQGIAIGSVTNGNTLLSAALHALEQDGLFKLLAEPNLVAISGEQAEFLAGGEIPIPVPQSSGANTASTITIEYKPYGVAVKFRPVVLADSRIRMEVRPEVSELDTANAVTISGFSVPALTTRRASTTVELAPGESFMIAGLLNDQAKSTINQLPGVKELPILGALFRSTQFQRNETELVIAVTPYVVDPMKSSDVKLPTDRFRPASEMEMFFYGALGSLSGDAHKISQTPSMLEGPIGFMVD